MTFPVKWPECAMLEAVIATNNNVTWFFKKTFIKRYFILRTGLVARACGKGKKKYSASEAKPSRAERFNFVSFPF